MRRNNINDNDDGFVNETVTKQRRQVTTRFDNHFFIETMMI